MTDLTLEIKETAASGNVIPGVMITPAIDEDYWIFRVAVSEKQAIVGFEKFSTVGIGFQHEEDWNTNLPYGCPAQMIYDHIRRNQGDDEISADDVLAAIEIVRAAAARYKRTDLAVEEAKHTR